MPSSNHVLPDRELEPPFVSLQGGNGGGYVRINVHVEGYAHGELEWLAGPSMALYGTGAGDGAVLDAADRLLTAAHDLTTALAEYQREGATHGSSDV